MHSEHIRSSQRCIRVLFLFLFFVVVVVVVVVVVFFVFFGFLPSFYRVSDDYCPISKYCLKPTFLISNPASDVQRRGSAAFLKYLLPKNTISVAVSIAYMHIL